MALVAVVMGSKSDSEAVQPCLDTLSKLGIECEVHVISAHRTPEKARQFGQGAREHGIEVIIAAAGGAAVEQRTNRPGAREPRPARTTPRVTVPNGSDGVALKFGTWMTAPGAIPSVPGTTGKDGNGSRAVGCRATGDRRKRSDSDRRLKGRFPR